MVTLNDIRSEAGAIYGFVDYTYNNCGRLNSCVSEFLKDNDVSHDFVMYDGYIQNNGESHAHEFIVIEPGEVEGVDEKLVVDVAFDQFCDENKEEGKVSVSFGSRSELPDCVIASSSEEFSSPSVGVRLDNYEW